MISIRSPGSQPQCRRSRSWPVVARTVAAVAGCASPNGLETHLRDNFQTRREASGKKEAAHDRRWSGPITPEHREHIHLCRACRLARRRGSSCFHNADRLRLPPLPRFAHRLAAADRASAAMPAGLSRTPSPPVAPHPLAPPAPPHPSPSSPEACRSLRGHTGFASVAKPSSSPPMPALPLDKPPPSPNSRPTSVECLQFGPRHRRRRIVRSGCRLAPAPCGFRNCGAGKSAAGLRRPAGLLSPAAP